MALSGKGKGVVVSFMYAAAHSFLNGGFETFLSRVFFLAVRLSRSPCSFASSRDTTPHLSFQADRSCINCVTFADEFLLW